MSVHWLNLKPGPVAWVNDFPDLIVGWDLSSLAQRIQVSVTIVFDFLDFEVLLNNVDLLFGGITIVCGIVGTLAGGLFLDRISSTVSNAFKLLSGATFLGAIFCFISFLFKSLSGFIVFSMGELLIFVTQYVVVYPSMLFMCAIKVDIEDDGSFSIKLWMLLLISKYDNFA
ncbi:hypothetical protein JHK86_045290 [Glycine max]|nr:hypothetical protein JHK86_045290 [Glycine max]